MQSQQIVFENIRTFKDQVEYILKKFPETRNSDKELALRVANQFGYQIIDIASKAERMRRYFNQRMMYLPTIKEVAEQRRLNMEAWMKALGYSNALF